MDIKVLNTGLFGVNTLIVPLCQNKVFVVDPAACQLSGDKDKIISYLKQNNLDCYAIVLTHSHFDHITGILDLKNAFPNAKIAIHKNEAEELENPPGPMGKSVLDFFGLEALYNQVSLQPAADVLLWNDCNLSVLAQSSKDSESEELSQALSSWKVLLTPGHTPGSICLYNEKQKILISGDTLFENGWGRTDMYGGDEAEIMKSLRFLQKNIPAATKVYPGHDSFGFLLS
ncbi:MAG: MBL fold metallo-hydrolase [Treponema sp.]|nr:MBL fold metallo-hydrolase [Treponema sp.]